MTTETTPTPLAELLQDPAVDEFAARIEEPGLSFADLGKILAGEHVPPAPAPTWERFGCGPYETKIEQDLGRLEVRRVRREGDTGPGYRVRFDFAGGKVCRGRYIAPITTLGLNYVLPTKALRAAEASR
jgi:hypothetical protein